MVPDMRSTNPIRVLVLEEFRLRHEDIDGAAARIVADSPPGIELTIPLLTSVEDRRDVATLRALHGGESTESDAAQHAALEPLVLRWTTPKHFGPRLTERSQIPPSSYRLAVTESGINVENKPAVQFSGGTPGDQPTGRAIGLLWIGAPISGHAGLLVMLGTYDDPRTVGDDPFGWPLPLSRDLGVRIYENSRA
jgi:hypothetical protein